LSREPQRPRPRIESLTDLIFGLALSIGALGLVNNKPGTVQDLLSSVAVFGFSFLILITIWLRYTETMSVLPAETGRTRRLNVLLLFLVALEPYLFNLILGSSAGLSASDGSAAYALDIGAIYAILASFNNVLASKKLNLVAPELILRYRIIRDLQIVTAIIFLFSSIPQLYALAPIIGPVSVPARYLLWVATFFFSRGTWILKRLGKL
jgi:uncharacterized membrane protein